MPSPTASPAWSGSASPSDPLRGRRASEWGVRRAWLARVVPAAATGVAAASREAPHEEICRAPRVPEQRPVHHRRQRPGRAGRPGPQRGRGGRPRARQARQRVEPQGQPRDPLRRWLGLLLQQRARPDRDLAGLRRRRRRDRRVGEPGHDRERPRPRASASPPSSPRRSPASTPRPRRPWSTRPTRPAPTPRPPAATSTSRSSASRPDGLRRPPADLQGVDDVAGDLERGRRRR